MGAESCKQAPHLAQGQPPAPPPPPPMALAPPQEEPLPFFEPPMGAIGVPPQGPEGAGAAHAPWRAEPPAPQPHLPVGTPPLQVCLSPVGLHMGCDLEIVPGAYVPPGGWVCPTNFFGNGQPRAPHAGALAAPKPGNPPLSLCTPPWCNLKLNIPPNRDA